MTTTTKRITFRSDAQAWEYLAERGYTRETLDVRSRTDGEERIHIPNPCARCGGGGYGGWHTDGGICYDCRGRNTRNATLSFSVIAYAKRIRKIEVASDRRKADAIRVLQERRAGLRQWARANRALLPLLRKDNALALAMRDKLIVTGAQWGLTEKQVATLQSIAKREAEKGEAPTTDKRIEIEGEIVKVDTQPGYAYGSSRTVMTVKVEGEHGTWLTWGTVPDAILPTAQVGARVRFTAKIQRSDRDPSFSFFKRPTGAEVLSTPGGGSA